MMRTPAKVSEALIGGGFSDCHYDAVGNKTRVVEANGDRVTWSYDPSYQLTRDRRSGTLAYDNTYTYDPAMNRSLKIASGTKTTYAYNAGNQIRRFQDAGGITSFAFDAAGNQTLERDPAGARTTNVWDGENRLAAKRTTIGVQTMVYDADHHRVSRADVVGSIVSQWDADNVVRETGPISNVKNYILKPSKHGLLLGWTDSDDSSSPLVVGWDVQQTVRRITIDGASFRDSWIDDAWGVPLTSAAPPPFGYVGRLGYGSDGYVRRRRLSFGLGRFLSVDPIIAPKTINSYIYALNAPLLYVDPSGMVSMKLCEAFLLTLMGSEAVGNRSRSLRVFGDCGSGLGDGRPRRSMPALPGP